ncbi:imm11 family protein, partial [Archangium sp.]|uniref:imm11 family protein n=1 Tax=Archangium sp. TaxID=1872627 RepID=UPI002D66678B
HVPGSEESAYIEQEIDDLDKPWLLSEGVRMGAEFPAGAPCYISRKWRGMRLDDFVSNKFDWLVVSERVRKILETEPIEVEWLPIRLFDQKKREVQASYALAHIIGTVDCIDLARSDFDRSAAWPEEIFILRRLVLDMARIPKHAILFRLKEKSRTLIIRSDLVEKFHAAGVTGFSLLGLDTPILL